MTRAVGATPNQAEPLFSTALRDWRGAAFHEFAERPWALPKVKRLTGLRQAAVERFASACLDCGRPAEAVAMHRVEPLGLALTATAYSRRGTRVQLEASNAVFGSLAVAGILETARTQRIAAIQAAADLNDPTLAASVIGGYDVPGVGARMTQLLPPS
ncbi:BTAD domain-containing putative transcriptional regulator [Paenarthrobacter nitroguajacolicus]|uniref:BTAD domain-containing putative transcriptional regulator n=1 Tax=Paenarthrobacter nitroguajacolicus TaxID=211146 RepID=UPI00351D915F